MFIGPTQSARAFNRYRWSNNAKLRPAILFVSLRGALFSSRQGRRRRVVGYASSLEVCGPEQMPKPVRSEAIASTVSCTSVATSSAAGHHSRQPNRLSGPLRGESGAAMGLRRGIERSGGTKGNWEVGDQRTVRISPNVREGVFYAAGEPAGNCLCERSATSGV